MDLGLTGRVALITGGSKGIGFSAAERLAEAGVDIHLAARTAEELDKAKQTLEAKCRVSVTTHPTDLSVGDAARVLIDACKDIDILVNNAGAIPGGDIHAVDEQTWRHAWDLKVFGYQNTCRAAYANMKARGKGVIINVIGAAGEKPSWGYVAGSAGNASLMALTRALGAGSTTDGIRVVAINPGMIETDRLITLARTNAQERFGDPERWRDTLDQQYPAGQPDHIGAMVAFLASDLSSNTTGTIITIDGGSSSRGSVI